MIVAEPRRLPAFEATCGILLALAAVAALLLANSPWSDGYEALRRMPGEVRLGDTLLLARPLLLWVNELWMALFFLCLGLEVKRELVAGELSTLEQAALPVVAAIGGMAVPGALYAALNWQDPVALRGWPVPAATDAALALGILFLLGSRVPASLKVFLAAVAVIDGLAALGVVAALHAPQPSWPMFAAAGAGVAALVALNRLRVSNLLAYLVVGGLVWLCMSSSGAHAALAGVVTAFAIPYAPTAEEAAPSPLDALLRTLQPWVAFVLLPVFVFANAGVSFEGVTAAMLFHGVPVGIALGLVLGKAVGVFGAAWLLSVTTQVEMPAGANRWQFFGVCVLCGVGLTMSLFIGGLIFSGQGAGYDTQVKLGVLGGSCVAAVLGTTILYRAERRGPARRRHQHLRESSFHPSRLQ